MSSVVQAKPERRSLEGLSDGGLGVRSPRERLEDIRDLCQERGENLRKILRSAWSKAHPREPLPVEWKLASSMRQVWVPDELTLYYAERWLIYGKRPRSPVVRGEVLRLGGHIWETQLNSAGTRMYFYDGQFHREDGPAVVCDNGSVAYWVKGELHRTDGPAVVRVNGSGEYWVKGRYLTKEKFLACYDQAEPTKTKAARSQHEHL